MHLVQHLLTVGIATGVFFIPSKHTFSVEDDIAEELQEQIDYLRKQLKDLQKDLAEHGTTNAKLEEIQDSYDKLQLELEKCYQKIDNLSQSLQQEFRQKLDNLQEEMNEMYKDLDDRITQLEEELQSYYKTQTVASIKDGMPNVAADNFLRLKQPKMHLPAIIKEAYEPNAATCFTLVDFVQRLKSDFLNAYGLQHTYESLVTDNLFSSTGSECAFKIGRLQQRMLKLTLDEKAEEVLKVLEFRFPVALKAFVTGAPFHMTKERSGCTIGTEQQEMEFLRDYATRGRDYSLWIAKKGENEAYNLVEPGSGLALSYYSVLAGFIAIRKHPSKDNLWKPVLVSNEQVALEYLKDGGYLRADAYVRDCYFYTMGNTRHPFYIHILKNE